jgi:hypothetical protein
VEDYRNLDVRVWHRRRLLRLGVWFTTRWSNHHGEHVASVNVRVQDAGVTLHYDYRRSEAPWQTIEQSVSFTWTPSRYGGHRPWFIFSTGPAGLTFRKFPPSPEDWARVLLNR